MSLRLDYQNPYPDRLTPRYVLDRRAREATRRRWSRLLLVIWLIAAILLILLMFAVTFGAWVIYPLS